MPISNRVIELFAGVGGFHVAAEQSGCWKVIWANQWEPGRKVQHAWNCYKNNFENTKCSNDDIANVAKLPEKCDLLVGGFPCQDYSVATTKAQGVQGKKGVLWWEIARLIRNSDTNIPYLLLENVDRLMKSPTTQRGRDFAVMLATLDELNYSVEWRVINAADYGYPQKRRRVFIFAWKDHYGRNPWTDKRKRYIKYRNGRNGMQVNKSKSMHTWLEEEGVFAKAELDARIIGALTEFSLYENQKSMPSMVKDNVSEGAKSELKLNQNWGGWNNNLLHISKDWASYKKSPFKKAGLMINGRVWTADYGPDYEGDRETLQDVIKNSDEKLNMEELYLKPGDIEKWEELKGAKKAERTSATGFEYKYSEGKLPFPDRLDGPSRTIITGEGGVAPSRFKHVVEDMREKWRKEGEKVGWKRRLHPEEVEELNGFERGHTGKHTDTYKGMPKNFRYFCMGNALVVGLAKDIMRGIKNI